MNTTPPKVMDLGVIDFHAAFAIQEQLASEVATGASPEVVLLLEHPPVYTIGSGGDEANILDHTVVPVRINRGGDITWHGPGQVVGYPIIDLGNRCRDLHRYLRFLEDLLIDVAAGFQVESWRIPGRTGVWTEQGKLAFIGVGVRRWVTMHGFGLNVCTDPAAYSLINPCGISDCPVTSLTAEKNMEISTPEVKKILGSKFLALLEERLPLRNPARR